MERQTANLSAFDNGALRFNVGNILVSTCGTNTGDVPALCHTAKNSRACEAGMLL